MTEPSALILKFKLFPKEGSIDLCNERLILFVKYFFLFVTIFKNKLFARFCSEAIDNSMYQLIDCKIQLQGISWSGECSQHENLTRPPNKPYPIITMLVVVFRYFLST